MTSGYRSDEQERVLQQYRTQDNLATRIRTHERYSVPQVDFIDWVLDRISWRGDEAVLDAGSGAGAYLEAAGRRAGRIIAGDLSLGMLRDLAPTGAPRVNLDAQRLPLAGEAVDVVLANHMLYHVPDREAAVGEFARVLRPGGRLLAGTNSARSMAELEELGARAGAALGARDAMALNASISFTLENGADLLSRYFDRVTRHDLPGALVFPEPQPVIDYLASMRERYVPLLPDGVTWGEVVTVLRELLAAHIAEHGEFRVNKLAGVFVCRKKKKTTFMMHPSPTTDATAFLECLRSRRSIRRYRPEPVPRRLLEEVLTAAIWAPSAHNRQPWRFAVLREAADKERLARAMGDRLRADLEADGVPEAVIEKDVSRSYARITGAPALVLVCLTMADMDSYPDEKRQRNEWIMAAQSTAMAGQNLLLAAHAVGLAACWMCAPLFCPETVKETLGLPDDWQPQGLVTLGYAAESREKARRPLAESVLFL
ncbi:MAG: nitroreductase family protein [Candidatus Promineifilaceae bacterium]|nr:nitroreductase family protein [Candidatus Promineifilaceae bacterium]